MTAGLAIHVAFHVAVPGVLSWFAFRKNWWRAWLIMVLTTVVDLDHLLANPVYDPNRCSIGFHPLHSYAALGAYLLMTVVPRLRLVGTGLLVHMAIDMADCVWIQSDWNI